MERDERNKCNVVHVVEKKGKRDEEGRGRQEKRDIHHLYTSLAFPLATVAYRPLHCEFLSPTVAHTYWAPMPVPRTTPQVHLRTEISALTRTREQYRFKVRCDTKRGALQYACIAVIKGSGVVVSSPVHHCAVFDLCTTTEWPSTAFGCVPPTRAVWCLRLLILISFF
jgi:hypothetical protein